MIEGLPWPAQVGVAGLGWFLFCVTMYGFITGRWLISRREADADRERIKTQDITIATLAKQNSVLLESALPTLNAFLTALQDAADLEERR